MAVKNDKKRSPSSNKHTKKAEPNKKKAKTTDSQQQQQQQSRRPRKHADTVEEAKRLWNQLRVKSNTPEQNRELMDKLMPLITGKANEIALQHDAARVVQAALQYGSVEERKILLAELVPNLLELCKSQYAHFCILKAIKYCKDDESISMIVKALKGHVAKLCVHAVASRVMELVFVTVKPKTVAVLKQELYGPHFSLFAADTLKEQESVMPTMQSNLKVHPEKKEQTVDFVRNLVLKCMEKNLYSYTYVQELFAELLEYTDPVEIRSMASTAADHAIQLLSTRAGCRVVAELVAYGTAKDRKRILKSIKGYGRSGLLHQHAYLAILRIVQLTDDTVSVQKNVLSELLTNKDDEACPLLELALSDTASKLFVMLLEKDEEARNKFFDPYERAVLSPNPTVKEDGVEVPTSKKEARVRQEELLQPLREPLIDLCATKADELLRSVPGGAVLREVYKAFQPDKVVDAVVDLCKAAVDEKENCLFEDRDGQLAIKNILLVDALLDEPKFAKAFAAGLKGKLISVAGSNRGAFLVAALCKVPAVRKQVVAELTKSQASLKKLSKGKGATAGFAALLTELKS